jgi:Cytochrome C oxidase, cbb3-type, subunit III
VGPIGYLTLLAKDLHPGQPEMTKGMNQSVRVLMPWMLAAVLVASVLEGLAPAAPQASNDPYEIPEYATNRKNPILRNDLSLRGAQVLWKIHCETCHGVAGRGDGPNARLHEQRKGHAPRNLTDRKVQENLTDGEIFWRISKGIIEQGNVVIMPRFEQKIPSETERWQLVLYVRELGQAAKR